MSETTQDQVQETPERRCSREQYDMLTRCSEAKDMTEWNEWRKANPEAEILLQNAILHRAHLETAILDRAHLETAYLYGAYLEGAQLQHAQLRGACLRSASLDKETKLTLADLRDASLYQARLQGTSLELANLEGAVLTDADLRGTCLRLAAVNGRTRIDGEHLQTNRQTDCTGVGLDSARVEPGLRQLLKYNVRRLGWLKWYKEHRLLAGPMRLFWCMSDYGRSGKRVLAWFFGLALVFALVYALCPDMIDELKVSEGEQVPVPLRAVYFSIVTMTTLGFGDMHAAADSWGGHILLTVQVLLGYVLLAALVTRLAILFTSGGPSADFSKKK